MKSYTVTLTSIAPFGIPQVLDHGVFWNSSAKDPRGTTFIYPATADGDANSSPGFNPSDTYTGSLTADDEYFAPWGYLIQDVITDIPVGPLKGPYNVTFDTSGLDTTAVTLSKIVYNFGDGSPEIIISNSAGLQPYIQGNQIDTIEPSVYIQSRTYSPQSNSSTTTYTPSITAYYSNISRWIYNISITLAPISIYEFDDIHLISNTQQLNSIETQNIFEVKGPDYLTAARVISAVDLNYPTVIPFDPNTSVLHYDLITWLDASDGASISKDANNKVWVWYDKSIYQNNYFNDSINPANNGIPTWSSPTFQYPRESQSRRKCVRFRSSNNVPQNRNYEGGNQYMYALASGTLGDKVFYTWGEGFTVIAVMKLNQIGPHDTLFAYDLNTNTDARDGDLDLLAQGNGQNYLPYLNVSFANTGSFGSGALTVEQGDTSYYFGTSAYDPNKGIYQPTTTGTISQNLTSYSLFSSTISGNRNATAYFTADTAIVQRNYTSMPPTNYQNSYTTLSAFLSGGTNSHTGVYTPPGQYDYNLVYGLLGTSDAYYNSYMSDAEISEFMLFDRPLNPSELSSVQAYLVNKWDLTLQTN